MLRGEGFLKAGMDVGRQVQEFITVSMTSPVRVSFRIMAWIMVND